MNTYIHIRVNFNMLCLCLSCEVAIVLCYHQCAGTVSGYGLATGIGQGLTLIYSYNYTSETGREKVDGGN